MGKDGNLELKPNNRFAPLDGIRGIAVLLVFFSHTSGRGQNLHELLYLNGLGRIGVYLFFVLSGFLLSLGLFRVGIDKNSLKKFYVKRTIRIIPLYYLICLSVYLYQEYTGTYNRAYLFMDGGFEGLLRHFAFLQADGVFWSILIEMHFYLIVPLLIYGLIRWKDKAAIVLFVVALIYGFLYLSFYMGRYDYTNKIIDHLSYSPLHSTFIDVFIFGILGAYFYTYKRDFLEKHKVLLSRIANISFIGLILLTLIMVTERFLIFERPFYNLKMFSALSGFAFSLIIVSSYIYNPLNKYFKAAWLRFVGVIGYSFYLIHFAILGLVNRFDIPSYAKFFVSFILICIVSKILFELIEKPSITLARKINKMLVK